MSDLDQIAAQADNITPVTPVAGQPGQAGPAPDQAPGMSNADAVAMLLEGAREFLGQAFGLVSVKETLNEANAKLCGQAIGPVLDKYGVQLGGKVENMPELGAALVAGPILVGAYRLAMAELKQRALAKQLEQQRTGEAPQPHQVVPMSDVYEFPDGVPAGGRG